MKKCQFCELKSSNSKLFSDAKYFAFEDIDKASAKQHVLVCTNKHIETPMDVESKDTLLEMREVGRKVLEGMCDQNDWKKEFRFGFHLPPFQTVSHVHLHCFVLPFESTVQDKMTFGKFLTSVEDAIKELHQPIGNM